jgi:FKBP-type peptidyl-prolyl cis-trans isomerase FklB
MQELEKVSYSLGANVAESLQQQGLNEIDTAAFAEAFNGSFGGEALKLDTKEVNETLQSFFQALASKKHAGNIDAGKTFLTENKTKDGVVELPSGLQYKVINEGSGDIPTAANTVNTHYHGTLLDGTIFDSSVQRGEPISFPVGGVIKGWTEALLLMPVGSKWELYVPSDLAYGPNGAGEAIGPHATLIFEVELLNIVS